MLNGTTYTSTQVINYLKKLINSKNDSTIKNYFTFNSSTKTGDQFLMVNCLNTTTNNYDQFMFISLIPSITLSTSLQVSMGNNVVFYLTLQQIITLLNNIDCVY